MQDTWPINQRRLFMRFHHIVIAAVGGIVTCLLAPSCTSWPVCPNAQSIGCITPDGGFGGGPAETHQCTLSSVWLCNFPQNMTQVLPGIGLPPFSVSCGGLVCAPPDGEGATIAKQQAAALLGRASSDPSVACIYVGSFDGAAVVNANISAAASLFTMCLSKGGGTPCNPCILGGGVVEFTGQPCGGGDVCCNGLSCTDGVCAGTIGCSTPNCVDMFNTCASANSANMEPCNGAVGGVTLCAACQQACQNKTAYPSPACTQCGFQ